MELLKRFNFFRLI